MSSNPVTPATIEHGWHWEQREHTHRRPTANERHFEHRLVCACGFATQWFHEAYLASDQANRHALEGQQSLA